MIDIAILMTVHNESVIAGPTIRSAYLAMEQAQSLGYSFELLLGMDDPTQACEDYFSRAEFDDWQKSKYKFRDQGAVRNALAQKSTANYLAFLDADDLFGLYWLADGAKLLDEAAEEQRKIIVHPELNWVFDQDSSLLTKTSQRAPYFSPYYFYTGNYYDALAMAPREAHLEYPYAKRDLARGFAVEDWQWNIETMYAGWEHVVAKDTVIFKRRRRLSQVIKAGERRAVFRDIEALKIDQVRDLGRIESL